MGAPKKAKHKLLDSLCESQGLANDTELAEALGMGPAGISKIRNKANGVGPEMILRVHERFGIPVALIRALID